MRIISPICEVTYKSKAIEEIQVVKQGLLNVEHSIKASAPLATSSPRSGLTKIDRYVICNLFLNPDYLLKHFGNSNRDESI